MTDKQKYWIRDADGVSALVEGATARDWFTKVKGWAEADEPLGHEQVHVHNEHPDITPGRLPFAVLPEFAGLGWYPGPPPDGPDDSVPADQPPVAEPAKTTKTAAPAAGEKKE
jgi:hypothetical protein